MEVNCAVECVNGCKLGADCPHQEHGIAASKFIESTSLDAILALSEEALRRRAMERSAAPSQWVFPEDGIQPGE
jgi:hypothetical protein